MIKTHHLLSEFKNKEIITLDETLNIIDGILKSLDSYHSSGLIHGNITPNLISINNFNKINIIPNFNIGEPNNQEELIMYQSPEQLRKQVGPITYATDCYSVGLIFYELSTGQSAVKTNSLHQMRYSQIIEQPNSPHNLNNKIPKALSDFILECISKNPIDRPQSATEFKKKLNELTSSKNTEQGIFQIDRKENLKKCWNFLNQSDQSFLWIYGESGQGKTELFNKEIKETSTNRFNIITINNDYDFINNKKHLLERICTIMTGKNEYTFNWFNEISPHDNKFKQLEKSKEIMNKYSHNRPLIICVDDIQWVNKTEINDLITVIRELNNIKLILISHFEPNKNLINFNVEIIKLDRLTLEDLMKIFNQSTNVNHDEIEKVLKIIIKIGNENMLHTQRILNYLKKKKLIIFNQGQWIFEFDTIINTLQSFGSNSIIEQELNELNKDSYKLIMELSLIGQIIRKRLLKELISSTINPTILNELSDHDILIDSGDNFEFKHAQIRFTIIETILTEEQQNIHKNYLSKLLSKTDEMREELAVDIAYHTNNVSKDFLKNFNHEKIMSIYDRAAKTAKHQGNYIEAIKFYEQKIKYTDNWNDTLDLGICLELVGNISSAEKTMLNALNQNDSDKQKVAWHIIRLMIRLGKHNDAIDHGLSILHKSRIKIDKKSNSFTALFYLMKTKWLLRNKNIESLRQIANNTDDQLSQLLSQLIAPSFMENKHLMLPIIYHLIKRMLTNNSMSEFSISCWGLILIIIGKKKLAQEWGNEGVDQAIKSHSNLNLARAYFVNAHFIKPWVTPLSNCIDDLKLAFDYSIKTSQWVFATFSKLSLISMSFFASKNIQSLVNDLDHWSNQYSDYIIQDFTEFDNITHQLCIQLGTIGTKNDPLTIEKIDNQQIAVQVWYYLARLIIASINGNFEDGIENYSILNNIVDESIGTQFFAQFQFWGALIIKRSIINGSKIPVKIRYKLKRHIKELKKMSSLCPANYDSMYKLILSLDHKKKSINLSMCEQAIEIGFKYQQHYLVAIGYELLISKNDFYIDRAIASYERWGAFNKAVQIQNKYSQRLNIADLNRQLDIETIYESSKIIANRPDQQMIQDALLENIKNIVDAEEGIIYLLDGNQSIDKLSISEKYHFVIEKMIEMTKTKDISGDSLLELHDLYMKEPIGDQTALLVPLQIRGRIKGIIFLQNHNLSLLRSVSQINHILILATQAAVLIENAEVISTLDKKIQDRTRDLEIAQTKNIELEKKALESRLTTGFAHEIRNSLSGAALAIRAVKNEPKQTTNELMELIDFSQRSMDRALHITNQISDYAKLGNQIEETNDPIDISLVIKSAINELLKHPLCKDIKLVPSLDIIFLPIREEELHSIIMNLVLNAMDSINEFNQNHDNQKRPGKILINCYQQSNQIIIDVIDNGPGISVENLPSIFEPFYTTKPLLGTGLGLSIIKRIIEGRNGQLTVNSNSDQTTFTVSFTITK